MWITATSVIVDLTCVLFKSVYNDTGRPQAMMIVFFNLYILSKTTENTLLLRACVHVPFSLSARRWWYEVVVIVVVVATSCSSLLPTVTADLLGWSSAIWRYTKSHYSVGHGLEEEERNIG